MTRASVPDPNGREDGMTDRVALVGVDWGDKKHAFEVRGADGSKRVGWIEHRPADIHEWVAGLRAEYPSGKIAVAIEQSRGALVNALMRYEFLELLAVHPKQTAAFRNVVRPSGAKDDPIDAALICEFVDKHAEQVRTWSAADPLTRELLLLVEWRRKLVEQSTSLRQQLTDTLKQYFPQALEWAGELDTTMALDFLEKWPTFDALKSSRPSTVRSFYTRHHSRSAERIDKRLAEMVAAKPLHSDQALIAALSTMVGTLVPLIRTTRVQIHTVERRIEQLWRTHPDRAIFESFPGAGPALAPRLAVALGTDRTRWTAETLQTFSGIAPVTVRSGRSEWVHARWMCPKFLRQTFHEFAANSIPHCPWAAAFYQQQRARGKRHHAAVRALAFRWIRIIVRCWKDRVPYDDARYSKRLIAAQSPLAAQLSS
jgi:transposase